MAIDRNLGLGILCVEDDADTAEVLVELLKREGYDVTAAHDAAAGIDALGKQPFQLVITDYMLPDKTGTELVREAAKAGLLRDAKILLFTAHPDPERVDGMALLRKPLAVDVFLRKVYDILAPAREAEMERAKERIHAMAQSTSESTARAEYVLYVSASSPASLRALRNMHELLAKYDSKQVVFTVVDLSKEDPPSVVEDRIAFTPTLVQRRPEPRAWILGDLHNIQVVADLLAHAGVEKKR